MRTTNSVFLCIFVVWKKRYNNIRYKLIIMLNSIYFIGLNILNFNIISQKWGEVAEQVKAVLSDYPRLKLSQGRKVWSGIKLFIYAIICNSTRLYMLIIMEHSLGMIYHIIQYHMCLTLCCTFFLNKKINI